MKKSLVALAALAVAGVASAQSSVTLFGVVDASISGYSATSRDLNGATFANPFYVNQRQRQGKPS
jgi:predicted porin